MRTAAALTAALLALSGCSALREASEEATSFDSVYALRDAVEAYGYTCDEWEAIPDSLVADEAALCDFGVFLSIHRDASQLQYMINTVTAGENQEGVSFATGPNWSVTCHGVPPDQTLCSDLAEEFRGDYHEFPAE
jgi:hypothetical protein